MEINDTHAVAGSSTLAIIKLLKEYEASGKDTLAVLAMVNLNVLVNMMRNITGSDDRKATAAAIASDLMPELIKFMALGCGEMMDGDPKSFTVDMDGNPSNPSKGGENDG